MKTVISKLLSACGYVPRGTPVVHEIRPVAHEVKWFLADAHAWHAFRSSETWKKLDAMSRDSMIQGMLPTSAPYRDDPTKQQAFVLGRTMQLEYLAGFAVSPTVPEDSEPDSDFAEE